MSEQDTAIGTDGLTVDADEAKATQQAVEAVDATATSDTDDSAEEVSPQRTSAGGPVDGDADSDEEADADDESDSVTEASGSAGGRSRRRPSPADLEREGEVAADFLERLLDIADLDGDIDVDIDGDRASVAIVDSEEGRVPRRLVGNDGSVLEALQELTRLAVQAETGERSRLMLDVAGFREGRRTAVIDEAKAAIEACQETGEPQRLTPMSAFERKVAHDQALAAGLTSESEGTEPRRYVVITRP